MFAKALGQLLGISGRKCCARKYDSEHYIRKINMHIIYRCCMYFMIKTTLNPKPFQINSEVITIKVLK